MNNKPVKTRIIVMFLNEQLGYTWRAPLIVRRNMAAVELRPSSKRYASAESARASAERHVRALFPGIVFE